MPVASPAAKMERSSSQRPNGARTSPSPLPSVSPSPASTSIQQISSVNAHPLRSATAKSRSHRTSDTIQHPSLTRVKGQIAMNTPPRRSSEISWLRDQSPASTTPCTPRAEPARSADPTATTLVNPTSALLQDLIKEERASRGSRVRLSDVYDDDTPRTPASSHSNEDTSSDKQRKVKHAFSAGLKQPHEMGIREMDQYISKINKLNFDLKLEIFHRQQQMAALEAKLERMQELEEELERMHGMEEELEELRNVEGDNRRLRQSNEQLRTELDKRDQAITEAVALICKLEAKVDELGSGRESPSRPTTALPTAIADQPGGEEVSTPKAQIAGDIPERTSSKRGTSIRHHRPPTESSRQLQRAPSFLCDESKNTAALRSLYSPGGHRSRGSLSVVTKTESVRSGTDGAAEPDSPRLSILSECSDLEPYGDTPSNAAAFDRLDIPIRNGPRPDDSSDSFVTDADGKTVTDAHIDRWLRPGSGLFEPEKTRRTDQVSCQNLRKTHSNSDDSDSFMMSRHKPQARAARLVTVYGSARLPPTPDTMSTAHAVAVHGPDGSVAAEASPSACRAALIADKRLSRPRSAGELTSRRNSINSIETSLSDTTHFEQGHSAREEILAVFPFSGGSIKANQLLGPGKPSNPRLRDGGGRDLWFNGDGIHDVRALRDERQFLSTTAKLPSPSETETPTKKISTSPPLTPQDWIDAAREVAKVQTQGHDKSSDMAAHDVSSMTMPTPQAQEPRDHPGRRRHSVSSDVDDLNVPRTRASLLHKDTEPKRRLSLRPRFFSRSATASRRLQPSPIPTNPSSFPSHTDRDHGPDLNSSDDDDCAPPPVIRKTRATATTPTQPMRPDGPKHEGFSYTAAASARTPSHVEDIHVSMRQHQRSQQGAPQPQHSSSIPAEPESRNIDNTLSAPSSAVRPSTSGSMGPDQQQQQRRRSSLGIFAWMKGGSGSATASASGSGSGSGNGNGNGTIKRSEPTTPTLPSVATFTVTGPTYGNGSLRGSPRESPRDRDRDRDNSKETEEETGLLATPPSSRGGFVLEKKKKKKKEKEPGARTGDNVYSRQHHRECHHQQQQQQHQGIRMKDNATTSATAKTMTAIPDSLSYIVSPPRPRIVLGPDASLEESGRRPPPRYVERRARREQLMQ